MIELISDAMILISGFAALIYGYNRWREYKHRDELWWCALGAIGLIVLFWDYASRHLLASTFDASLLFWSRQLGYLLVFLTVYMVARHNEI